MKSWSSAQDHIFLTQDNPFYFLSAKNACDIISTDEYWSSHNHTCTTFSISKCRIQSKMIYKKMQISK